MRLYTVIPITRSLGKETLSYFGPDSIEPGSLVSIPLRKKTSKAIVIDAQDIATAKSEIKKSSFALRKIIKVDSKHFLSQNFLKAALETAKWYATTTGAVLQNILPELILENALKIKSELPKINKFERQDHLVVQADTEERMAHYKSFIRGQFAKQKSVYFCLPTIEDIRQTKHELQKGIEQYTVALHSSLTKKEFSKTLDLINNESHPILIIGTVPFLSIERADLGSIILDRENSRSYKTLRRPYLDLKTFVENLAIAKKILLLSGDLMLSVETLWKEKNDEYIAFTPLKMRLLSPAEHLLVDMKNKTGEPEKKFKVLSPELEALIDKTKEENENIFIFSARKGLAPSTICGDCGQIVACSRCQAPVTLYTAKSEEENFFLCNKCGLKQSTSVRCINCDSWKLQTLGIGIELVESEIRKRFPDVIIFRVDKDSVKTEKKARDLIEKFENTPGSVLLGTELALFYLNKAIENVAVASIDSFFSLPDFRINEKIFYSLLTMRERAQKVFLIQTRNINEKVFEYALKGNLADFYRDEVEDRKTFLYPPFSIFIKLSIEGKFGTAQKVAQNTAEFLKEYEPSIYPSFSPSKRGNSVFHILIRKIAKSWPDPELETKLKTLPLGISIRVDPESLL
jgi:primosomal protein N' (replication factor Y)